MSDENAGNCVCMGVGPMVTSAIRHMGPVEAGRHFRAARIEFLKGIRALLDSRIEHLSRPSPRQDGGATVPVD